MKIFYIITATFLLTFIGCSSTYTIKDFSSKDKFYEDFNKFADNKSLKITLTNDSSFVTGAGTKISNDTLIFLPSIQEVKKTATLESINNYNYLPINKVKEISYKNRWSGLSMGFLGGTGVGFITGLIVVSSYPNNKDHPDSYLAVIICPVIGAVVGSVLGISVGYTYTYQFNP